jgi:hypothetical protein
VKGESINLRDSIQNGLHNFFLTNLVRLAAEITFHLFLRVKSRKSFRVVRESKGDSNEH